MSRKCVGLLALLFSVLAVGGALAASAGVAVFVDGQPLAARGFVRDGVTYLPVRAVAEALGVSAEWDPATHSVYVTSSQIAAQAQETWPPQPPTSRRPAAVRPPAPTPDSADIVHITRTGKKYHAAGCRSLSRSDIPISRADAIAKGYTACSICKP